MIACKACGAENSVDSKFCKMCGDVLAHKAEINAEEAESLIRDGFRLISESRPKEALFLAEAVTAALPANPGGWALKAMSLEESGNLQAAESAYEKVVELKPESTLDRIKLSQVRKRLEDETGGSQPAKNSNIVAITAALGAALAVVAIGVALALSSPAGAKSPEKELLAENSPQPQGFVVKQEQPQTQQNSNNVQPATQPPQQSPAPQNREPVVKNPFGGPLVVEPSAIPRTDGRSLPDVGNPASVPAPATTNTVAAPPPGDSNLIEPKDKQSPGRIVITPSASQRTNDPAVSDNIYRVAQQKMATGDYSGAIRDFTAALAGSRKPALIHQLIGRCYARTGNAAEAKRHFETALQMYEAAGSANEAKACKRELDLLDG